METYHCIFCKIVQDCFIKSNGLIEELYCKKCNNKLAWRLIIWLKDGKNETSKVL